MPALLTMACALLAVFTAPANAITPPALTLPAMAAMQAHTSPLPAPMGPRFTAAAPNVLDALNGWEALAHDRQGGAQPTAGEKKKPADGAEPGPGDGEKEDGEFGFGDGLEDEFAEKEKEEIWDPLEWWNRPVTGFNDWVYVWVLEPVASGYTYVVPEFGRRGISNFVHNLRFPIRFVNNILQFELLDACVELGRFVINTTVGILGLWDPARDWFGLEAREEDFGQTLGRWGVGAGPHLVLPFLGPSNLRDSAGMLVDYHLDPVNRSKYIPMYDHEYWSRDFPTEAAVWTFMAINETSLHLGEYESLKKDAFDLYPFLRDAYEQSRNKKIKE